MPDNAGPDNKRVSSITTDHVVPSIGRRRVVQTAAWSVPAVIAVSAAPAYAATGGSEVVITPQPPAGGVPTVERCASISNSSLRFSVTIGGLPAPDGTVITLTLPQGLVFASGGAVSTATIVAGTVIVPTFRAVGSAGTYAITASYGTATATQTVTVVPAPGSVFELRRSQGGAGSTATFSPVEVSGVTTAVAGAIVGDAGNTSAQGAVVTSGGQVRFWGEGVTSGSVGGASNARTLGGGGGYTLVDVWKTLRTGDKSEGGVAAGTGANSIRGWYADGAGNLTEFTVGSVSGTVLAVFAEDGWSYAHTTVGVFRWSSATTTNSVAAVQIAAAAGATAVSTWSTRGTSSPYTVSFGGHAVVGNNLVTWSGTGTSFPTTSTIALPSGAGSIARVQSGDTGLMLLTTSGALYSYGAAFGGNSWIQRATGVSDFSLWTYINYHGGLWIDGSGGVTQFFGSGGWVTPVVVRSGNLTTGTPLSNVTKVFSSDGTYLTLSSDGTVHAWGGNLDNSGRGPAVVQTSTGAGTTVDLNVWGHHVNSNYTGGGYVIKGVTTCPV